MIFGRRIGLVLGSAVLAALCAGDLGAKVRPGPNALATTRDVPEAFDTGSYTVTTVSASVFTPQNSYVGWYADTGGGRYCTANATCDFYTGLDLPGGAIIDFIGLNSDTYTPFAVGVEVVRRDQSSNLTVIGAVDSTVHAWGTDRNLSPIGYLWHGLFNEGLLIHVQAVQDEQDAERFGWVEIWWRRSVSPALGAPTFNDVPANHPFFQFVEALAASGTTGGCGNGNYCPDNPVTRGQMAVFLAKALGLHWPGY